MFSVSGGSTVFGINTDVGWTADCHLPVSCVTWVSYSVSLAFPTIKCKYYYYLPLMVVRRIE